MFAHPSTHQVPRIYGHSQFNTNQTTSKKNLNKENTVGGGLPSKTPSRLGGKSAVPGTSIRIGLGEKTGGKNGNLPTQPRGGGGGEKGKDGLEIEPKRLFASTSTKPTVQSTVPPSKSLSSFPQPSRTTHKTPGPARLQPTQSTNLRTPAPPPQSHFISPTQTSHLSALQLSASKPTPAPTHIQSIRRRTAPSPGQTPLPARQRPVRKSLNNGGPSPGPTPLPSASRTRRRSRQSLTPNGKVSGTPARGELSFSHVTPGPKWEEENSLGSITEGLEGVEIGGGLDEVAEVDEGSDDEFEIEYMPPPVQALPWKPSFEMPDLEGTLDLLSHVPVSWAPAGSIPSLNTLEPELHEEEAVSLKLTNDTALEEPLFRKTSAIIATRNVTDYTSGEFSGPTAGTSKPAAAPSASGIKPSIRRPSLLLTRRGPTTTSQIGVSLGRATIPTAKSSTLVRRPQPSTGPNRMAPTSSKSQSTRPVRPARTVVKALQTAPIPSPAWYELPTPIDDDLEPGVEGLADLEELDLSLDFSEEE